MNRHNLLSVLSDIEYSALYEVPIFNKIQRQKFLNLNDIELQFANQRNTIIKKIYCCLQIGYFKAVKQFYYLSWEEIPSEDIDFIFIKYFQQTKINIQKNK